MTSRQSRGIQVHIIRINKIHYIREEPEGVEVENKERDFRCSGCASMYLGASRHFGRCRPFSVSARYFIQTRNVATNPRVILSGIQPTGTPHVIFLYFLPLSQLTGKLVRQLPRSALKLGGSTKTCSARGYTFVLNSGLACLDFAPGPERIGRVTDGHVGCLTGYRYRP